MCIRNDMLMHARMHTYLRTYEHTHISKTHSHLHTHTRTRTRVCYGRYMEHTPYLCMIREYLIVFTVSLNMAH